MATTSAERTVQIPDENRVIIITDLSLSRRVYIPKENRLVIIIDRKTTSADRTVLAV